MPIPKLTVRYERDIPELFKYNAFCVISDGINNKAGSFFASYDFFYAWRRIAGMNKDVDGIDSMFTLIQGMFQKDRLRDILRNFIYIPDTSKKNEKIVCRYPQYHATRALFENIKKNRSRWATERAVLFSELPVVVEATPCFSLPTY